jgi:hypothetical protein
MPIYLLGGAGGNEPPFSRSFFNTTLGDIIERSGKDRSYKLTLYLVDGSTLDVCKIEELADQHMSVRAFQGEDDTCELSLNIIPYGTIYRLQLSPKEEEEGNGRVGFHWAPAKEKTAPKISRKTSR